MSFYTSLSGLNASQTDLNVTSNNIANANTNGFKSSRAEFSDIISSTAFQASNTTAGQGTRVKSISQDFTQGSVDSTGRSLDLLVSGSGFFVTKSPAANAQISYTRDGSFTPDNNGNIVDGNGNMLQVLPVDSLGNVTATGVNALQSLHVSSSNGTPKQTSNIDVSITFPTDADLPASRSAYASGAGYTFSPTDANSYNNATSITVYDSGGNAIPATVYYVRTSKPSADGTSTTSTWDAHTFVGDKELTPAQTLTFNAAGTLTSPTAPIAYDSVQPTGAVGPLNITVDYGSATKQGAYAFSTTASSQDGNTVGTLNAISVGQDGLVSASYSNGTTVDLGKVAVANFTNPEGLHQAGNTSWTVTGQSGAPQINEVDSDGSSSIASGELETSNVDLTAELVNLISAQRNFQANSKAIDTDKQMFQSIVNIN